MSLRPWLRRITSASSTRSLKREACMCSRAHTHKHTCRMTRTTTSGSMTRGRGALPRSQVYLRAHLCSRFPGNDEGDDVCDDMCSCACVCIVTPAPPGGTFSHPALRPHLCCMYKPACTRCEVTPPPGGGMASRPETKGACAGAEKKTGPLPSLLSRAPRPLPPPRSLVLLAPFPLLALSCSSRTATPSIGKHAIHMHTHAHTHACAHVCALAHVTHARSHTAYAPR